MVPVDPVGAGGQLGWAGDAGNPLVSQADQVAGCQIAAIFVVDQHDVGQRAGHLAVGKHDRDAGAFHAVEKVLGRVGRNKDDALDLLGDQDTEVGYFAFRGCRRCCR